MAIEQQVHDLFIANRWTLSLAESCTGGSIAARLTRLAGASQYFLGSLVVYSNALKTKVLGVPEAIITQHGAVSEEVVLAMLQGSLHLSGSDFALAVSGIAGPSGGTPTKPVGTIWGGIGHRDGARHVWTFHIDGERGTVIERTVDIMLQGLVEFVT